MGQIGGNDLWLFFCAFTENLKFQISDFRMLPLELIQKTDSIAVGCNTKRTGSWRGWAKFSLACLFFLR